METAELRDLQGDAAQDDQGADARDQQPGVPLGPIVVLHAPRHALEADHVKRHEGDVEADEPAPEGGLAEPLIEREAEGLGEPVGVAGEGTEHHAADDHVVKVRHQEQAVVQHEVRRRARPAARRSCRRSRRSP